MADLAAMARLPLIFEDVELRPTVALRDLSDDPRSGQIGLAQVGSIASDEQDVAKLDLLAYLSALKFLNHDRIAWGDTILLAASFDNSVLIHSASDCSESESLVQEPILPSFHLAVSLP